MRTTVTLDPDTEAYVRKLMRKRRLSFKEAVNQAIRAGLAERSPGPFTVPRPLGPPRVDLTKALRLAGELEDEALARKLVEGR